MKPTVGRIVHYISTLNMDGEIIDPWPALVIRVEPDGRPHLLGFSPFGGPPVFLGVRDEATGTTAAECSGRWMWPPRKGG
jgi:hypothetical protein